MIGATDLILAFLLDLAIGDPRWMPHPVRLIGRAAGGAEKFLRRYVSTPAGERRAGVLLVLAVVAPAALVTALILFVLRSFSDHFSAVAATCAVVYLTSTTLATRGLIDSAGLVIKSVKEGSLESARSHVGMIVGRDTQALSEKDVLKATIETLAENLSDGIVAPLFYLSVGGLPLAVAYKAINTLDSMVGYKNARYLHFGRAAARLDDIANYLPARITGVCIVVSVFLVTLVRSGLRSLSAADRSFRIMLRDGGNHTSPNSGIPEASMAGALGVRLGGPSTYGGVLVDKPYIGEMETDDYLSASERAVMFVKVSSVLAAGAAALVLALRSLP
ncbi:MAG: adenosylcobinamide-phosphate synthase CbiB [Nitrospirae bacterium]|nr:adenosylcobinamide-phosphate synthase CbiB [Nitrospirota bacterium]